MPVTVNHVLTATTPDNTSYEIRPSHWNSVHSVSLNLSGTDIIGAFTNANGATFSTNPSGYVGLSYTTPTLTAFQFSNSNGVTFGTVGSTVTATVQTNYLTAQTVQTQASGAIAGSGFTGTNATGTLNSLGLALSVGIGGGGGIAASAAGASQSAGTIVWSNANNVSFGMNGSSVTATASFSQSVQTQASGNIAHTGFATTTSAGTAIAGTNNTAGFTLGVPPFLTTYVAQTTQTQPAGNIVGSGFTGTNATGTLNSNGLALSVGAGGGATTGGAYLQGNTTGQSSSSTYALSSFNISGAGIISAGWSNSSLIISAPASTGISQSLYATGNTTQSTSGSQAIGSILFNGAGNVSVGVSNGSVVISGGSAAAAPVNFSAGTTSNNLASVVFSNSNGVSFGLNGSTITGSYNSTQFAGTGTTFAGTNISGSITLNSAGINLALSGNTGGAGGGVAVANSQTTYSSGTANFIEGGGAITIASTTGQSFLFSVPQTSSLVAGANITISSAGSTITIIGGTASPSPITIQCGNRFRQYFQSMVFSNSNNVSFGLNGSTITGSASFAQTVQTQASGNIGGTGFATTTTNGLSVVGTNNTAGITLAVPPYITTYAAQTIQPVAYSAANGSAAFSTITFANSNGVSFSTGTQGLYATVATNYQSSNANYLTSQSNQAASASNGSFAFQTLGFSNANNVTFGTSAGSIISASVLAQSVQTQASGNIAGTGVTTTTQAGSTLGVTQNTAGLSLAIPAWLTVAAGGGAAISAAGNSVSNGTVVFSNNAQISFGMAGSTITGSVNAGAAAGIAAMNNSNATYTSGTVQLTEGGGAITIASGTGQRFAFSVPQTSSLVGTNGISIATAGSTISIDGTALSAALPVPYTALSFANRQLGASALTTAGAGSLWISPVRLVAPLSASTGIAMISITGSASSATSGQFGLTASYGLYSQNSATTGRFDSWFTTSLSASAFFTTGSVTYAFNGGSTSSTTSNGLTGFYGPRIIQFPIGTTMQTGVWLLVSGLSSSTAGYASFVRTCGAVIDNPASFGMGTFGQATNASVGYVDGGIWTTTTAAMPASMSIGDIKHTNNAMPFFMIGAL